MSIVQEIFCSPVWSCSIKALKNHYGTDSNSLIPLCGGEYINVRYACKGIITACLRGMFVFTLLNNPIFGFIIFQMRSALVHTVIGSLNISDG